MCGLSVVIKTPELCWRRFNGGAIEVLAFLLRNLNRGNRHNPEK
jgi:hypothetical protein